MCSYVRCDIFGTRSLWNDMLYGETSIHVHACMQPKSFCIHFSFLKIYHHEILNAQLHVFQYTITTPFMVSNSMSQICHVYSTMCTTACKGHRLCFLTKLIVTIYSQKMTAKGITTICTRTRISDCYKNNLTN